VSAFNDINPQAPTHILVIPREHINTLDDTSAENQMILGKIILVAKELAAQNNLEKGYRLVFNCKEYGGQDVFHLHLHLLGGRRMTWPPG